MTAVDFVRRVVETLNRQGIPYMAVGSFSSNVYGKPRSTKDADFVIELGDRDITQFARDLGSDFSLDPQMSFETITSTMRYRLVHQESRFMVELFLLSGDSHDQERFRRRVAGDLGGFNAYVASAEDVVVTKLRWSRQGKRPKDIEDVRGVMLVQQGNLDLAYIRHWTDQHGTRELFESLMKEISPG